MAAADGELDTWLCGMLIGQNPADKLRALKVVRAILDADPTNCFFCRGDSTPWEGIAPIAGEVIRNAGYLSLVEDLQESPDQHVKAEAIKILLEHAPKDEKEERATAFKRKAEDVHEESAMPLAKRRHVGDESAAKRVTVNLTAISGNKLAALVVEPEFTAGVVALKARKFLEPGRFIESLVLPSGVLFERQQSVAQVGLSDGDILVASIFSVPSLADLHCKSDVGEVAAQRLVGALDSSACVRYCIVQFMELLDDDEEDVAKMMHHLHAFEAILQAGRKQAESKTNMQVGSASMQDVSGKKQKKSKSKKLNENWGEHLIRLADGFDRLEDLRGHVSDRVCDYAEKILKEYDTDHYLHKNRGY